MSTLILEGTLIDNTGVLQCALTGTIAGLDARCSLPVDSTGLVLCVADSSQARTYLCGLARATSTGYLIVDASGAATNYAGGLPVTSTGALVVDTSGAAGGSYCAGVSFTSGGKVRATGLS